LGCPGREPGPRPHVGTPDAWADLPLRYVRPERHMALGLACLALGVSQASAPMRGHLALGLPCLGRTVGPARHVATPRRVLML